MCIYIYIFTYSRAHGFNISSHTLLEAASRCCCASSSARRAASNLVQVCPRWAMGNTWFDGLHTHTYIYIYIDLSIYLFIMLYPQPRKNAARGGLKRKQSVHKGNKATLVVTVSLLLKPTDLSALTNHPAPLPAQQPSRLYHKAKNCHKHKLTPFH